MNKAYFILHIISIAMSYLIFFAACIAALLYLIEDRNLKNKQSKAIFSWMPNLPALDKMNYKCIGLGFVMLTVALIAGVIWNKDVSGAYWDWNSKWIYSLAVWLFYAIILHVRLVAKLRGRKIAILSIISFCVIIFSLFKTCS